MVFFDESGFSLDPLRREDVGADRANSGVAPPRSMAEFSAVSAITPRGKLYIKVHEGLDQADQVIAFLKHLLRHIRRRPIMVFWDGGNPRHSKRTQAFLPVAPSTSSPSVSGLQPELNPDEWVWSHLKNHRAVEPPATWRSSGRGLRHAVVRMRLRPSLILLASRHAPLRLSH